MSPLDQSPSLRIGRFGCYKPSAEAAAEIVAIARDVDLAVLRAAEGVVTIPGQDPRNRAKAREQLPRARTKVLGLSRGDKDRREPPRIASDHREYRQLEGGACLTEADRYLDGWKPQAALCSLAGKVSNPVQMLVRPHVGRS